MYSIFICVFRMLCTRIPAGVEGRRGNYNLNLSAIRQIGLTGVISSFRRDKCVTNADMDSAVQKKCRGTIVIGKGGVQRDVVLLG
jgi:hypothetical protein